MTEESSGEFRENLTITLAGGRGELTVYDDMALHIMELIKFEEKYLSLKASVQELADR